MITNLPSRLHLTACLLLALSGSIAAAETTPCTSGETGAVVNLSGIAPAASVSESQARLQSRKDRTIAAFAGESLPNDCRQPGNSFAGDLNTRLDSRDDVSLITTRAIAKILQGQRDPDLENILLAPNTKPFSRPGTSQVGGVVVEGVTICDPWAGDYDFALIDMLNLYFVAKDHDPGNLYFSKQARDVLLDKMFNVRGKVSETYRLDYCGVAGFKIVLNVEDTENHILMTNIARYLTNQIMYEKTGSAEFNNVNLGNKTWMLNHLAKLMREHFYEYNSNPYQRYTVSAIALLHSYSNDQDVRTAAKNLLDMTSAWSAVQSNNLRSFPPFRRQLGKIGKDESRDSSGEFQRLSLLVGNYHSLGNDIDTIRIDPKAFYAVNNAYRMDPVILDLAIRRDPASRYFVGMHDSAEIYASSPSVLISAGGSSPVGEVPAFDAKLTNGQALESSLLAIVQGVVNAGLVLPIVGEDRGVAVPTVIIPTRETSTAWSDMVRFEGNRDLKKAAQGENLCVAPGFACGLQLKLGNRLAGLESACSVPSSKIPGMRFYNLNQQSGCPNYGLYMAVYQQPCDTDACRARADNYGFVEVGEASLRTFADFKSRAETTNATTRFASSGIHTYNTVAGPIKFEIAPPAGQAPVVEVNGTSYGRDFKSWPRARSQTLQSTRPGLVTIDSIPLQKRLILDMTNPSKPQNISAALPFLMRYDGVGGGGGTWFDDGDVVIPGKNVKWIALDSGVPVSGVGMGWHSGIEVSHGAASYDSRLDLASDEFISEVKVCAGRGLFPNANYLRVSTNKGRSITAGFSLCLDGKKTYTAPPGQQIVAFTGRASEGDSSHINQLGVIMSTR